jgi:hypothetical protein
MEGKLPSLLMRSDAFAALLMLLMLLLWRLTCGFLGAVRR